jgi:hypothetical protein
MNANITRTFVLLMKSARSITIGTTLGHSIFNRLIPGILKGRLSQYITVTFVLFFVVI